MLLGTYKYPLRSPALLSTWTSFFYGGICFFSWRVAVLWTLDGCVFFVTFSHQFHRRWAIQYTTIVSLRKADSKSPWTNCWWMGDDCFLLTRPIFRCELLIFREGNILLSLCLLPSLKLTARPWKWMIGRLSRFLLGPGLFSGAFGVSFGEYIILT